MEHLSPETLARLVDEAATEYEAAHLARCGECRRVLEEYREQTAALGALPVVRPPRDGWPALEARLAAEGLVTQDRSSLLRALSSWSSFRQAAAGVVLFAAGLGLGAQNPVAQSTGEPVGGEGLVPAVSVPGEGMTRDEALAHMELMEGFYLDAIRHVRGFERTEGGGGMARSFDPTTRMAALETMIATNRAALRELPTDPLFNQIQLHLIEQRDAVARQVGSRTEERY